MMGHRSYAVDYAITSDIQYQTPSSVIVYNQEGVCSGKENVTEKTDTV